MTRGLPFLLEFGLLVFCLIDCIQSPEDQVRNLRKVWWIVLIIVLPLAGSIAWLFAGRPRPSAYAGQRRMNGRLSGAKPPVLGPDDDPEFLERLAWMNRQNARRQPGETSSDPGTPETPGTGGTERSEGTGTPGARPEKEHGTPDAPGEGIADETEGR